ncbi:RNA-binding protein 14-like isoform X1 [Hyla sarda]|uniref:RNA-binding protein 14-like isoform X1 n=1 Tax=Hyla sarda TaxID=327740 RepID=UPI0024C2AEFC|nr:RNA-binding protein 14-like isoform X1 [Hyla sarda]
MRDTLKIFVGNVDDRTTQQELSELFEKHGTVVSCAVMKQYAFVHMRGADRANKAIEELNGRELHGKKMVVELSKPRPQNTWKIFVGNVGTDCDASDLRTMFEAYGKVIECDVVKDYAFVHMERESDAREAIDKLNGREIRGKRINVEMSNKAHRPMGSNGSSHSSRSRRSHEYRDAPQGRSETYNRRRATEAAYASYALKSQYDRYGGDSARYDSYESRVRPPSPMYYSRDRSPLRRSPTRSYYEGAMTSAALASKYRSPTSDYNSLSSAYGGQTTPSLSSAFGSQTSALTSAYANRTPATGNQTGYESQATAYGVESSYSQATAAYRPQGQALTSGYSTQIPSMASSYTAQTPANPYGSMSTATPYAAASGMASAYRQPQNTAYDASQISGIGTQAAYSSLSATNDALMYERTCLSPPRSSATDSFKKTTDAYKRLAPDRRYSELSDYRRLTQKPQDPFRRSPPKSHMDFRRTAETQPEYSQYAAQYDYLRAAQVPGYQRRM